MNVPTRLAGFVAGLGLAFGGVALAGAAIDPTHDRVTPHTAQSHHGAAAERGDGKGGRHMAGTPAAGGLAVSDGKYSLKIDRGFFSAGKTAPFSFRIIDARGRAVRGGYEIEHDKELHLIVVRRDTALFEHVHPRRGADGTWSVDVTLREPGVYRAYADFKLAGKQRTLAADLFVPGDFRPDRLPAAARSASAQDESGAPANGLEVALKTSGVGAGRETSLTFAVTRAGRPLLALEPYLGAQGHLVALREGDLAYLHVHPVEAGHGHAHQDVSGGGEGHANEIGFMATFPTAAATGCSCNSRRAGRSAQSPTHWRYRDEHRRFDDRTARAAAGGHDLFVVRESHRAQAQQTRGRAGNGQLCDREGRRPLRPGAGDPG